MRPKYVTFLSGLAVFSISATSGLAQDRRDHWEERTTWQDRTWRSDTVQDANRASRVIGMRVHNDRNQELGRIEDVVFDLQSGRVAYVVLATPGPDGDKLVPVPASELFPADNRLVLNIDRARLERLPGFARNAWPDLHQPFAGWEGAWTGRERVVTRDFDRRPSVRFEERFQPDRGYEQDRFSTGTTGTTETYRYDRTQRDQPMRWEYHDQGTAPAYEQSTRVQEFWTPDSDRRTFRGRITAISPEARTMTIEGENREIRNFVIAERPRLGLKENRYPRISDLKVGFPVSVGFRDQSDGALEAHTIIRTDAPEVR